MILPPDMSIQTMVHTEELAPNGLKNSEKVSEATSDDESIAGSAESLATETFDSLSGNTDIASVEEFDSAAGKQE